MVYLTGDTHGDVGRFFPPNVPSQDWGPEDSLIVAGDFGCIFGLGLRDEEKLDLLAELPYRVLFLDGNHECFPKIYSYPVDTWCGGKVHVIRENVLHLMRGQVFEIENMKIFTMGGGYSIDQMYRIPGRSWWPEEMPTDEEYDEGRTNLEKAGHQVDFIISHAAPAMTMRYLQKTGMFSYVYKQEAKLWDYLEWAAVNTAHRHYYFGHLHMDRELPDNRTALYYAVVRLNDGAVVHPGPSERGEAT